jgi:glycosyltransferase involved in cell wall biosynthesis/uncharacterized membrane protein YbhN (UPF0104 family)
MKRPGDHHVRRQASRRSHVWARLRFISSWIIAVALVGVVLPRAVDVSWHGVIPVLTSVHWPAILALAGLWLLGLYVHSFVLTAAAPNLTHRRALTLNMTGSAVANVVPLGGAAGVELNRRTMKAWGIDTRAFTGYTILTNLWDVGSKLLLPILAVLVLTQDGQTVTPVLRAASLIAGAGFLGLAAFAAVLVGPRATNRVGRFLERFLHFVLRLLGRDRSLGLADALLKIRRDCCDLVAGGWVRMSAGIGGYVALQCLLLALCLHLTGARTAWPAILAGFAVERLFTVVPITPGGIGVADLGLVGVLLARGGDPAGITAAAVLYRAFILALDIPVGGSVLGIWFLRQRRSRRPRRSATPPASGRTRIAHVTDVFLPRLGGIETHVDDLVRHQRVSGLDAEVLTPTSGGPADPAWVHRIPCMLARRAVTQYDAVHVHLSLWSPYGISVARAAMAARIPTLITLHSMWAGAGGILRLAAHASLRRWPVAWSAVSRAAADAFRHSLGSISLSVLPNAIDVASWRPSTTEPRISALRDQPITLVSVMRLMPRKRPLQLLKVFEEVGRLTQQHDVNLVIVGDGPLRRRVERYVQRRGLSHHVRITGHIPRHQVRDQLLAASLYVAPAPKESFGIAALEARCTGLPVIAKRRSGIADFIRDRVDGILVADDTKMIVAIAELINDDALRNKITAHNQRVAPELDWSSILQRTDTLYQRAAERAGTASPTVSAPHALLRAEV